MKRRPVHPSMAERAAVLDKVIKELADRGKIIEGGWAGLRMLAVPDDAPAVQVESMRMAFFAGAHHLFTSIMAVLDPEAEVTQRDIDRMTLIRAELDEFGDQLERDIKPEGNA